MNWEYIDFFTNLFLEMERENGTILEEEHDSGWGWYVFI